MTGLLRPAKSLGLATLIGVSMMGTASARPNIEHEYQYTERQLEKARQRVAQLEARLEELGEERARSNPHQTPSAPNCDEPFEFDSSGIKRWRQECNPLSVAAEPAKTAACDTPFRVDKDGIKHVQLECVSRF